VQWRMAMRAQQRVAYGRSGGGGGGAVGDGGGAGGDGGGGGVGGGEGERKSACAWELGHMPFFSRPYLQPLQSVSVGPVQPPLAEQPSAHATQAPRDAS